MAFSKNKNETGGLPDNLPGHIAFIMDGNGRWAKKELCPEDSAIGRALKISGE